MFVVNNIAYLSHVIYQHGVQPNPEKIEVIIVRATPTNITELHGFLGLTGFYKWFVQHHPHLVVPLTNLL